MNGWGCKRCGTQLKPGETGHRLCEMCMNRESELRGKTKRLATIERGSGRPDQYLLDGEPVPSVTEILEATEGKPALDGWHMKHGFRAKLMKQEAADVGSAVHDASEEYIHTDDDFLAYAAAEDVVQRAGLKHLNAQQAHLALKSWVSWRTGLGARYRFLATEIPMVHPHKRYGMTTDGVVEDTETGEVLVYELKTSTRSYPSHVIQTAAYALGLNEVRGIEATGSVIVRVDKGRIVPGGEVRGGGGPAEVNVVGGSVWGKAKREFVRRLASYATTRSIARFYGMKI
ncbi:MAG: PD-(D/E)XK nuclease family protein [Myxococcota bacterium]